MAGYDYGTTGYILVRMARHTVHKLPARWSSWRCTALLHRSREFHTESGCARCSEGGFFNAVLSFPQDYPQSPPTCRFTSEMWHPNGAYSLCHIFAHISIAALGWQRSTQVVGFQQLSSTLVQCTRTGECASPSCIQPAMTRMAMRLRQSAGLLCIRCACLCATGEVMRVKLVGS